MPQMNISANTKFADIYDKFAHQPDGRHIRGEGQRLYLSPKHSAQSAKIQFAPKFSSAYRDAESARKQERANGKELIQNIVKSSFGDKIAAALFDKPHGFNFDSGVTIVDLKVIRREIDKLLSAQQAPRDDAIDGRGTTDKERIHIIDDDVRFEIDPSMKAEKPPVLQDDALHHMEAQLATTQTTSPEAPGGAVSDAQTLILSRRLERAGTAIEAFAQMGRDKGLQDFGPFVDVFREISDKRSLTGKDVLDYTKLLLEYHSSQPSIQSDKTANHAFYEMYAIVVDALRDLKITSDPDASISLAGLAKWMPASEKTHYV